MEKSIQEMMKERSTQDMTVSLEGGDKKIV
jgi:hypothetical protein